MRTDTVSHSRPMAGALPDTASAGNVRHPAWASAQHNSRKTSTRPRQTAAPSGQEYEIGGGDDDDDDAYFCDMSSAPPPPKPPPPVSIATIISRIFRTHERALPE